ncbi:MAG: hypothetical protein Q6L58_11865, partial [Thermostichales cyanobacterium BF3_bins_165]
RDATRTAAAAKGVSQNHCLYHQDIHEALKLGDRVAILQQGSLVQLGTPLTLLTQPADDYVWAFTQEVSRALTLTPTLITCLCSVPTGSPWGY